MAYEKPENLPLNVGKDKHRCQHRDDTDVGITWQRLQSSHYKKCELAILNTLKMNFKIECPSEAMEDIKKNKMEILELKNTRNGWKTQWMDSIAEW